MHAAEPITAQVSSMAILPLLVVLIPALGALLVALLGEATKLRNAMVLIVSTVTFGVVLAMYQPVMWGAEVAGELYKGIVFDLPAALGVGLHFRMEATGLIIATVTAFVYLIANIYSMSYMTHEHAQTRYYIFLLLTLAANLGVFVSSDFFTLFVFFEIMAIASYVLVVHGEDFAAMTAGRLYLFMSVIGGLVLLGGLLILAGYTGSAAIRPMAEVIEAKVPHGLIYVVAAMMIIGFGTKAGLFFLHVWLPEAHPVAPSPASALLSGLMVKVGVYGIMLTVMTLFGSTHEAHGWTIQTSLGYALMIVATVTMFGGMANALLCNNAKELLAYSTISQVGYITLGLGAAAYLGAEGAMGMGGVLYHIVNHAVFKAALFLCIGVVVFRVAELDITKLGGLWRKLPATTIVAGLAVLSIAGIPGTAGFASKTLLHHSIVEAIDHSAKLSATHAKDPVLVIIEWLFLFTAAGTFCYTTKLFVNVFTGKLPRQYEVVESEPWPMRIALCALGAVIVFFGFRPNLLLETFIGPALANFNFAVTDIYKELFNPETLRSTIPILFDPATGGIITNPVVIHNFVNISLAILLGGTYFIVGYRFRVFELHTPELFSVKVWYERIAGVFIHLLAALGAVFDRLWNQLIMLLMVRIWIPRRTFRGAKPLRAQNWLARRLYGLCVGIARANAVLDRGVSRALVDTWLSEPARVAAEQQFKLTDMAYWVADANKLLDKALTAVMVDMWISEPGQVAALGTPGGGHRPVPGFERKSYRERRRTRGYGWINTVAEIYDRLVSTVMVDAWLPENMTGEITPPEGVAHEETGPETVGPAKVARPEEAKPPEKKLEPAPTGAGGLLESWYLLRDWVKGPGATAWRVMLFVAGTLVLVVALLIGLGYLKF